MARNIDRRRFGGALAGASAATLAGGRALGSSPRLPNILWLVSEDNSPWLGCYGNKEARTPNLDRIAAEGVVFDNAFANAPVCAPGRSTLHTGMHACSLGTEHMRSMNPIPDYVRFFTECLRDRGYFCANHFKTDYNTAGTPEGAWDENGLLASWKHCPPGRPFFSFINFMTTHESSLHRRRRLEHDPADIELAPYHPDTEAIRQDYAHYHDRITEMDGQAGKIVAELDKAGALDDTIIFYFSDHGGVLPRSKRMLYDTGMRVPLMVRFPEKYRRLSPRGPGTRTERLVSFVDFAPTVLSLAGLAPPRHMQGRPFLGREIEPEPDYVFGFRGRMDERYDLSRAVRDRRFKYIRNFYPHLPRGRRLDYLWKMPAMESWAEEYAAGRLDAVKSRFFEPRPPEELYDTAADPHEIRNLASDPAHCERLRVMREACRKMSFDMRDPGFLQEAEMMERSRGTTPREMALDPERYDIGRIHAAALAAGSPEATGVAGLVGNLEDGDSGVRYWGAVGLSGWAAGRGGPRPNVGSGDDAGEVGLAIAALEKALGDSSASARIAAAEALARLGERDRAAEALSRELGNDNIFAGAYAADAIYNAGLDDRPWLRMKKDLLVKRFGRKTNLNAMK